MSFYQPGTYTDVPVTGQGFSESKEKKTPYFFLKIKPGEYEREIVWYLSGEDPEAMVDKFMSALGTLGFDGSSFAELDPNSPKYWDFSQITITCECKHEPAKDGSGKVYERWQLPFAGTPREVAPLDSKGIRKLDALFGKKLKDRFGGKRGAATRAATVERVTKPAGPKATAADVTAMNADFDRAMAEDADTAIPF